MSSDDSQMIIEVISPSVSDLALDCLRCLRFKLLSAKNSLEFKLRYSSFLWGDLPHAKDQSMIDRALQRLNQDSGALSHVLAAVDVGP